ncbi:GNAT family N-acetyltransferase [Candidatus Eisenbacteria bacterium]|uniref:GNAT family N-acetyltransferase n=1 Tax=Eiseniibacteriota bacterium TaxID=2212470 RepID=A0ABV6YIR2_UNCEI
MHSLRPYQSTDEPAWLRCRVLAFLDSAYYDDVLKAKPVHSNPSLDLVAEANGAIVGLIDVEHEVEPDTLCSARPGPRAMIWTVAVLPEYRKQGIARELVEHTVEWAKDRGVRFLEAWTRDDPWVLAWYEAMGFRRFMSYWHLIYNEGAKEQFKSRNPAVRPQKVFAHLLESPKKLEHLPDGMHECSGFELAISS